MNIMPITIITQLACLTCDATLLLSGDKPQRKALLAIAKDQGWERRKAGLYCATCKQSLSKYVPTETPSALVLLEPFFSVTVDNTHDPRNRYWGFGAWAKVITEIDLSKTGGYAFVGEEWLSSKYMTDETAQKYFFGKYQDFTLVAVGYHSGSHAACWLVEVDKAAHDTRDVTFGKEQTHHDIFIQVNGGRVVFTATSQRPKALVAQAVKWGATADMLKNVTNPNYYVAMYLQLRRDEWKYQGNPYAIEIE